MSCNALQKCPCQLLWLLQKDRQVGLIFHAFMFQVCLFVPRKTHLPCRMQTPNANLCNSLEGLDVSDIFGSVDLITLLDTLCRAKLWCMSVHICMYAYIYIYICIYIIQRYVIYMHILIICVWCRYMRTYHILHVHIHKGFLLYIVHPFTSFPYNKSCRTHFGNLLYWPCVLDP